VREQPEQQAPPVQRLRIRYAKRGRLRFTSHRDFSRAFERAVMRARIPMAYSSGFHPHPRISYAGAAPTGSASEAEYLEIGLAEVVDPATVASALADALPDGLDVLQVVESPGGSLADLLTASHWTIRLPAGQARLLEAVGAFLAADAVPVERMTKKGLREFDCRAAVVSLAVGEADGQPELDLVLRHTVPAVRPDDVLTGLGQIAGEPDETAAPTAGGSALMTRWAQGPLDETTGSVGDPLASSA
jgi:radical SAM-linked protein